MISLFSHPSSLLDSTSPHTPPRFIDSLLPNSPLEVDLQTNSNDSAVYGSQTATQPQKDVTSCAKDCSFWSLTCQIQNSCTDMMLKLITCILLMGVSIRSDSRTLSLSLVFSTIDYP